MVTNATPKPKPAARPGASSAKAGPQTTSSVLVLDKVRRVMDAFSSRRPDLTLQQLQQATDLPMTTCARLVRSLVETGILQRRDNRYQIGTAVIRWAAAAVEASDLIRSAQTSLDDLRDLSDETAVFHVPRDDVRVLVAAAQSRQAIAWRAQIGSTVPLAVGASGKAILAYARHALDLPAEMRDALDEVRRLGYAVSFGETGTGAAGISAPVLDHNGIAIGAIGIVLPVHRATPEVVAKWAVAVRDSARAASLLTHEVEHSADLDQSERRL